MKKILNLLSVLTISGTVMPNVIAVSKYEKDYVGIKRQNNNGPIIINDYQNEPIAYNVNYYKYWNMWANWSTVVGHSDYSSSYLVVDYINYAETFDKFVEKYPNFTLETNGKAVSESTFGDVGKEKFGTLYFDTITFNNNDIKYINLVDDGDSKYFSYNIIVKIGLGFKKIGSKLYLYPFIDGYLRSIGTYTRYLEFGLTVNTITFNPKTNN